VRLAQQPKTSRRFGAHVADFGIGQKLLRPVGTSCDGRAADRPALFVAYNAADRCALLQRERALGRDRIVAPVHVVPVPTGRHGHEAVGLDLDLETIVLSARPRDARRSVGVGDGHAQEESAPRLVEEIRVSPRLHAGGSLDLGVRDRLAGGIDGPHQHGLPRIGQPMGRFRRLAQHVPQLAQVAPELGQVRIERRRIGSLRLGRPLGKDRRIGNCDEH